MTRDEFLQNMLERGKVTQAQIDKVKAKDAAKEKYKKDKDKLTKAEMQEVLGALVGG
jgi:hypothetical protein